MSTRFFEGFLTGAKFSIIHNLVFAPFFSKERSLENGTRYFREYISHAGKACVWYSIILSLTFGMRHAVINNKDIILFDLTYNVPWLRKKKHVTDIMLYMMFAWPLGFGINHLQSGKFVRGGLSLTLLIALVMRALDGGNGLV